MAYSCRMLADSVTKRGHRLSSFEIIFPRPVLSEYNTHCMLARNSASSRAIPVITMIRNLLRDTFIPERFGINQPGMQSAYFLDGLYADEARLIWRRGRDRALLTAIEFLFGLERAMGLFGLAPDFDDAETQAVLFAELDTYEAAMKEVNRMLPSLSPDEAETALKQFTEEQYLNVHKQIANRVLEPYLWHTVVTTATEWSNFFALRNHADAQPEIRTIAAMMQEMYGVSEPRLLADGEWHLPLIQPDEGQPVPRDPLFWPKISSARMGRVSYLTHAGIRDLDADTNMFGNLSGSGHMSPMEHPGRAMIDEEFATSPTSGKFTGFIQFRKLLRNEHDFGLILAERAP